MKVTERLLPLPEGRISWYAVQVRSRHEKVVAEILRHKSVECWLPLHAQKHAWSDRTKELELPLFPGYVFAQIHGCARSAVLTTTGVVRIAGAGNCPVPVDEGEIASIQQAVASGLPCVPYGAPHPRMEEGDPVEILSGPLRNVRGVLVRIRNENRLVIAVTLLQRSIAVELNSECVSGTVASVGRPRRGPLPASAGYPAERIAV